MRRVETTWGQVLPARRQLLAVAAYSSAAVSAEYPFVCNDGSVSGSKKDCRSYWGGGSDGALGLIDSGNSEMKASKRKDDCSCRDGQYCTGPRGGQYCLTDSGEKSYLRK